MRCSMLKKTLTRDGQNFNPPAGVRDTLGLRGKHPQLPRTPTTRPQIPHPSSPRHCYIMTSLEACYQNLEDTYYLDYRTVDVLYI
jgi:hypothetical protein